MNETRIEEIRKKAYSLEFCYSTFFNDIQKQASNKKYDANTAYADFEYICDRALKLKKLEEIIENEEYKFC